MASDAINGDNSGLKPAVAEIQSGCDPVESALLRALEQRRKQNHISQQSRACAKTRPWRFDGSRGPEASSVEDYAIAIGSSSPDDITMEAMTCSSCREEYDPSWNDYESCEYHTGQFFKLEYILAISLFSLGEMEINFDGTWWPGDWDQDIEEADFIAEVLDSEGTRENYSEILRWDCCGKTGDNSGCKLGRHLRDDIDLKAVPGRDLQPLPTLWYPRDTDARTCGRNLFREFYHWENEFGSLPTAEKAANLGGPKDAYVNYMQQTFPDILFLARMPQGGPEAWTQLIELGAHCPKASKAEFNLELDRKMLKLLRIRCDAGEAWDLRSAINELREDAAEFGGPGFCSETIRTMEEILQTKSNGASKRRKRHRSGSQEEGSRGHSREKRSKKR